MATPSELPHYRHRLEIFLEDADADPIDVQLNNLLTSLFQWMRVGRIIHIADGPASGRMRLEFDVITTCPPHELGSARLHMVVKASERLEP